MNEDRDAADGSAQGFVALVSAPLVVYDRHLDVVAANEIAGAVSASFAIGMNLARFTFLNPMVEETTEEWAATATMTVSALHRSLRRHGEDERFRELVGELITHSAAFTERWAEALGSKVDAAGSTPASVREPARASGPQTGVSVFTNPLVGVLRLRFEHLRRIDAAEDADEPEDTDADTDTRTGTGTDTGAYLLWAPANAESAERLARLQARIQNTAV